MSEKHGLGQYLEMVRNGIRNRDKIIESLSVAALVKNGEISDEALAEIMRRRDLCATCSFNSEAAEKERGYKSLIPFKHCTLCLCRIGELDSKEACLSCNCGMEVWNKNNPDLPPMELRWTAFKIEKQEDQNLKTTENES